MVKIPESLQTALRDGRVLPFVGAGVSMAVESTGGGPLFPSWKALLLRGADRLEREGRPHEATIVRALIALDKPRYLEAAQWIRDGLGAVWPRFLKGELLRKRSSARNESLALARAVWDLGSWLVITTNYDRVLRWACPEEFRGDLDEWDIEHQAEKLALLRQGEPDLPTVWHLHGIIQNADKLILTPEGYQRLYPAQGAGVDEPPAEFQAARTTLRTLMATHTFLFLGFSLEDEHFSFQLRSVSDLFGGYAGPHYAMVHARDRERFQHLDLPVVPLIFEDFGPPLLETVQQLGREAAARPAAAGARPAVVAEAAASAGEILAYTRRLKEKCASLPAIGYQNKVRIPLRLDEVYVPLRARVQHEIMAGDHRIFGAGRELAEGRTGEQGDLDFREALDLARNKGRRGLLVLGDPGSGKTTLLKHLALDATGLAVPVLVELRYLTEPGVGLRAALVEAVRRADATLSSPEDFAQRLMHRDHLLVLVDGLDEVPDPEARLQVCRWLEEATGDLPESTFVITSRYAGYRGETRLDGRFLECHVRDLDEGEIRGFLCRWYEAVEAQVLDRDAATAHRAAEEGAQDLAGRLFKEDDPRTGSLQRLAGNPLMLQILCLVHRDRHYLPEKRVELYRECVHVMLEEWRRVKDLPVDLTAEKALSLLQPVAFLLHRQKRKQASPEEILPALARPLEDLGQPPESAEALLATIRDQSGVLVSLDRGDYGFLHLSFQEYLCARHLQNYALSDPALLSGLVEHFHDPWWQEVVLLAVGLSNPSLFEALMSALLSAGALERYSQLADECLREAWRPTPEPFLEALARGVAEEGERYQALRLLRGLPGWPERSLEGPKLTGRGVVEKILRLLGRLTVSPERMEAPAGPLTGRGVVETLAAADPSPKVRALASELLGRQPAAPPVAFGQAKSVRGASEPRPGEERVHEVDGSVLVYVPGGEYRLGEELPWDLFEEDIEAGTIKREWVEEWISNARPVHTVRLTPFWMGKYPVTNAQYREFLASSGHQEPESWQDKRFNAPRQPVVGVSWEDAVAYCRWSGLGLPSEAQWEAAARGTDGRRYPWGPEEPTKERANFDSQVGRTSPVDAYPAGAGPFGTFDQAGNVLEWCQDVWNPSAYVNRDGERNPVCLEGDELRRVLRGGSWAGGSRDLPAAHRSRFRAEDRFQFIGFRVCVPVPAEP